MRRSFAWLVLLALLVPSGVALGQEDPAHVYLAFYKVGFDDLDEWNRQYWEYAVPVLEELRAEGVIQGWNQWQHDVGSEYNVRFAVRTYDWASLGTFWSEYLSRLREVTPEAEWDASSRMIQAHRDEIWDVDEIQVSDDLEVARAYVSSFQLSFADTQEWDRIWSEVSAPILQEAMDDGLLGGWVKLTHNTGGPHNGKVIYLFEEWDDIEDMWAMFLGTLAEDHPEDWSATMGMVQAHDDVIWAPTTR